MTIKQNCKDCTHNDTCNKPRVQVFEDGKPVYKPTGGCFEKNFSDDEITLDGVYK